MERQTRLLTILVGIALAMLAAVLIDVRQNGDKKHTDDDPNAPDTHELVDYKPEEVATLTVKNGDGEEVKFEKSGSTWSMVAPKQVPIEERKVSEIVDRFNPVLVEERTLTGDPVGYGLDPASRAVLTFGSADGRSWTVYVGKATTVGYGTYVQTPDGPVGVAQTHLDLAHRGIDDFRSKALWTISSGTARRIQIDRGDQRVVLRKDDHGWWQGDEGPRVDESAVSDWLQKADMLRADSFVDDGPAELKPTATLTVEDADGTHTLAIGESTGDEESVTVKGAGPLANVPATVNDLVKLDGWAGVGLMPVNTYQVDTIALVLGDYTTTLKRTDGEWKDADGKAIPYAEGLLQQLDQTHADRATVPTGAASGWGSIVLTQAAGGTPHSETVNLGELVGTARIAKDAAGGPAFSIAQADLDVILGVARGTLPPPRSEKPQMPDGMEGMEGMEGLQEMLRQQQR